MDFEKTIDRKQTSSVKWDRAEKIFGSSDVLPMWVADMDFDNARPIKDALRKMIDDEVLGYTFPPDSLFTAISNWQNTNHNMPTKRENILLSPGVLSSIAVAVQAFTDPGDSVLIHDPVYPPFFSMVNKNERQVYRTPLNLENGQYSMDFDDIERQFKDEHIKMFVLSNPHNPGGRVWSENELIQLVELCKKYSVILISDEIHSDLVYSENTCVSPVTLDASYKDWVITLHSATKTFNIAGVKTSFILVFNEDLKEKLVKVQEETELDIVNTFGMRATEAALAESSEWHVALLEKLEANRSIVTDFFDKELSDVVYMVPEATYLFWFDASRLGVDNDKLRETFARIGKIGLNDGVSYGPSGKSYMRLNFAVPQSLLIDGLKRIKTVFDHYSK
ncbi:cystathione beta-lyase [Alkalibacterium subtropicum]|uniref:cysteine-S-conjugate beta-lyase n=1 Tax=Alkalibacterium subtropicum TaxID=753702 RepID=A0A1I1HH27_9LACT|nr:MalY/PatB family protein [Alkalibacterium subtropicum]SFC21278.1 cystathione beta-lyase [Alkalibacterium subtropicum]